MLTLFDPATDRVLANIFIVLMLVIIGLYDLPFGKVYEPLAKVMERALKWSGLWHGWSMFAPSPSHVDRRLTAEFMLDNGEIIECPVWDFGTLGKLEAVIKGRHRKLRERVIEKPYNVLKPSYCYFLVQQFYREQLAQQGTVQQRVQKVWLYDCSKRIPEYGVAPEDQHFYKSWFFTYDVPKELESELNLYQ